MNQYVASTAQKTVAVNKVIRNTYTLLSATLIFSGVMAAISTVLAMPPMTYLLSI